MALIKRTFAAALALVLVCGSAPMAWAEDGVTDKEVLIGSCSALDGPAKGLGIETTRGAEAYVNHVNSKGGVNGRKIRLIKKDDGYEPDKAVLCFKQLMEEKVFAMGFFVGTPTGAKHAPLAENNKIPLVGLFTGAQLLHDPFRKQIFNVRASYWDEAATQVNALWDIGKRKIAVLYQDDAFGVAVLSGVKRALEAKGSAPVALGSFQRNTLDVDQGMSMVKAANPDAVVMVGPYAPLAAIIKKAKDMKWDAQFLTVSFVGTESFIKEAGPAADGVIITQVVPPPTRKDLPTVKLYNELIGKQGGTPGFVSLEGFVDAMVLAEGLKRAGKELTREKLLTALESIKDWDAGLGPQLKATYGSEDHKAFDTLYPTVVRNGQATVFRDWKTLK